MRPNDGEDIKDSCIGNVLENNFDEIWFGKIAEEIRQETLAGRLHKKCQCVGCPFVYMKKPYPVQQIVYNEYPDFLEIDLPNTHCNVGGLKPNPVTSPACIMCERASPSFKPEENRLFEVLERIKHVVPNLRQMHIQGVAEPFYATQKDGYLLFDVLDALNFDTYKDQITLSVTTNGTLFKKSVREEYLKRAPNSITIFSIDAATPETFKAIRIFDCFDKVIDNLNMFSEERTKGKQFIRIHNNINTMNVHEVVGMVRIAHRAGVESVEFNPTCGFNERILVNEKNCGRFKKAQNNIIDECNRLGVSYNFLRDLDLGLTNQLVQITLL